MAKAHPIGREEQDHDVAVKDFSGVNIQASRTAISESEFAWLENVIPIGYANLKCLPAPGAAVATLAGVTINYWKYVNIANVDYLICFTTAGSGHAINLASFVVTLIGAAATFSGTVATAQWKNERTLIIASNGYWSWDAGGGLVSLGGVTGAPSAGQTIGTFAGRVWVGNNRTITGSAPNSYTDFQTASSGFSFIITDETLHSNINAMFVGNNFLYVFGDSSVNVISDVRLGSGSPVPTIFSNTNISAFIGTNLPYSIFPFGRSVGFSTRYGFYVLDGATPQKISDKLDTLFPLIDYTRAVSGDVALLYNLMVMCFGFRYNDPLGARFLMALNYSGKWFFASQGDTLTLVAGGFQSGVPAMFGTDGTNVYKLFSDTAGAINSKIQTALWPMQKPTSMKEAQKAGVEMTTSNALTAIMLTLDSDFGTVPVNLTTANSINWINGAGVLMSWINGALSVITWITGGFAIYQADAEFKGRYIGYTMTSSSPGYAVNGFLNQHQVSTPWATRAS